MGPRPRLGESGYWLTGPQPAEGSAEPFAGLASLLLLPVLVAFETLDRCQKGGGFWLAKDHGEVKSMHTAPSARRKGIGTAMLQHIIAFARSRGISRLSLETGSWDYFQPAIALYRKHGFVECQPFDDYVQDPNSVFMTLDLCQ